MIKRIPQRSLSNTMQYSNFSYHLYGSACGQLDCDREPIPVKCRVCLAVHLFGEQPDNGFSAV